MRVVTAIPAMQRLARRWRRADARIGFVPTMGYLHDGHLSLVRAARRHAGHTGKVVVSVYVNPTQFGLAEDLASYPHDLDRDLKLCRDASVDAVFAPTDAEMYPVSQQGSYSTFVVEDLLSRRMEGASRPTHFRGVTTVVAKLFNIVLPDVAVFGEKDWQQATVLKRMVANLNFPLQIVVAPTVRESDGLALSSRNKYLDAEQRRQAVILSQSIEWARVRVRKSSVPAKQLKAELARLIATAPQARLDYVECFDPDTLAPVTEVSAGTHLALAVFIGKTRLIDNGRL